MYIPCIYVVYNWFFCALGLFGNHPTLSILHWGQWWWLRCWRCPVGSRQHVDSQPTAFLPLYSSPTWGTHGCLWSLSWRHSTRLGLLQLLWGSAPESNRHNRVQWSEKTVWALPCSHTLCWKDSGPSVLSGRQCRLHYSSQVRQPTKDCLWLRVRSWSRPGLAERKPCLRDQYVAVVIWSLSASRWRPVCAQSSTAPQGVQVWGC